MNSTYFTNQIMGNVFGTKKSPVLPTRYFLGLSKTAPNQEGGNVSEPSGNGYVRCSLDGKLSSPTTGEVKNTSDISFPEATGSWGTITHYVVFDSQSGGNLLIYGSFAGSKAVDANTVVTIKSGSLRLKLDSK